MKENWVDFTTEVFWIGGSVCSGKSTITRRYATGWGMRPYDFDTRERDHLERLGREALILERLSEPADRREAFDRRWLHRPPAAMAARAVRTWSDRFRLVLEDLTATGGTRILAQGIGLFPQLVAPHLSDEHHAIWLIATPEFIRWARWHRGMSAPSHTSDPRFAAENIIARDVLIAEQVQIEADRRGLTTLKIDGSEPVEATAQRITDHFHISRSG